ncbi:MAG TPA: rhodanese-like domain-containing protein [Candidatus Binataceae bacterium]|nr:rhodanese-like domain-containing protein [Candidatus Binataceae bacterium]
MQIPEIEPGELKSRLERGEPLALLDVREAEEVALAAFPNALHVPMAEIPSRADHLDRNAEWVVICHHGVRSAQVAMYLAGRGFRVANLSGGIDRWSCEVDPATPRY